ncbi:cyclic nucleotide-binding domain-containing protein [Verrucomicrobiales bacterium]|jgi:CRP-like cAMP-binding protein|nr:cyclic nucleotide-binding domain-containing protein [Verrucomicrobiales bacterium]MDB4589613.1 cyclic nucleotide-binding domain-containing protein [Verrucomicrobiales bacterium]MDB4789689.1 cyclic nucleotide-binding domain-containing protein [Verrucomicrobiales bacterium]MDC0503477.1 cyclic nucleotide-binding domain-containing protein [Verrucomicrobiales bacterium]MDF1786469.1 cyclic nucleotide-binding domain-containing protein [Verrucomicrobiales bacterium]
MTNAARGAAENARSLWLADANQYDMTANPDHPAGLEHGDLPALGILEELDPKMRARLSSRGRLETLKPGTFVIHQGRHHHGLSVIIKGKLSVSCHAHGDYLPLAELGPGHTVGEMSLLDPQKSSADVCVSDEEALLWTIDGDAFNQLVESDHEVGCAVFRMLGCETCRRLRQNSDHMLHKADEMRSHFLDMDY